MGFQGWGFARLSEQDLVYRPLRLCYGLLSMPRYLVTPCGLEIRQSLNICSINATAECWGGGVIL